MPTLPPDSTPPDADARVWLEAMVTRIEDDPDLLATMSDAEVEAALAEEGIRASGVQAAIRRRVREAPRVPARSRVRRTHFNPFMATAVAMLGVIALASLWWIQQPRGLAAADVLAYEATLTTFVRPPSKGLQPEANDLLSEGAQSLLSAAQADDALAASKAANLFAQAHDLASSTEDRDAAAFFAGLAYGLLGQSEEAVVWLRRVSPDGAYGEAAREGLADLGG